jgi:Zn-dependent M28 family amino/carboxypeptidase
MRLFALLPLAGVLAHPLAGAELSGARMLGQIKVLSSDAFEGRGPGTPGEDRSVAYIVQQFQESGLEPGNPDGTFMQSVPLVGITSHTSTEFAVGGQTIAPTFINDYIAYSRRTAPHVEVKNSEMIFVGYGVVAPEYNWDDYKGVDVRGKTVVMLVNDPQVADPRDPSKLDDRMFKGATMTYYGRWMYKYEEASAKGAAACLIVHETGPAGYPFAVVAASQGRENFDLRTTDGNARRVAVEGWLTLPTTLRLFAAAGLNFAQLKAAACRPDFQPVVLHGQASFAIDNTVRDVASHNVIAKVTGSDPRLRDQYIVYSAHWDHLGRDPRLKGDQIYHGAQDNASGTAVLLELARAYAVLPPAERPRRTMLFLSVTAEEKGLLGSRYYVEHPLYPLNRTLADINMDQINVHGRTSDIQCSGYPSSMLDDTAVAVAQAQGRTLSPENTPEQGHYYRSDHFEFALGGVPACMVTSSTHFIGQPEAYGVKLREDYTANIYHKVADVVQLDWPMDGAVQEAETLMAIGVSVDRTDAWPQWRPGNEFKARRDAMMAAAP